MPRPGPCAHVVKLVHRANFLRISALQLVLAKTTSRRQQQTKTLVHFPLSSRSTPTCPVRTKTPPATLLLSVACHSPKQTSGNPRGFRTLPHTQPRGEGGTPSPQLAPDTRLPAPGSPFAILEPAVNTPVSEQDHMPKLKRIGARPSASRRPERANLSAASPKCAPYVEGDENQAPPRQERAGFRRRPQEGRPHDSLRLILPGRSCERLPRVDKPREEQAKPSE